MRGIPIYNGQTNIDSFTRLEYQLLVCLVYSRHGGKVAMVGVAICGLFPSQSMDTTIEVQRQTHEEIERFERALSTVLSKPQPTLQARLTNEHKASQILDRITSRAAALDALYNDEKARNEEISLLSMNQNIGSGEDELSEFYARLVKIKEHHLKYPDSVVGGFELELAALVDEPLVDADDEFLEEDRTYLPLIFRFYSSDPCH